MQIAGKNVISKPCAKPPATQPFTPPSALPNTPAVAPQKKCGTTPGKIRATGIIAFNPPRINSPTMPPTNELINPMVTALGAYVNATGQSSAGLAPGTSLSAMPLKAGTISPIIRRTPLKMM